MIMQFEIRDIDKKISAAFISKFTLEKELKTTFGGWIDGYFNVHQEQLIKKWLPLLCDRYDSLPTDKIALCEIIFKQPDYKDKDQLEQEAQMKRDANFSVQ